MVTNFFTGSENLYKYLVSVGMLMAILSVHYPLKEKQNLEIEKNEIEKSVEILNFEIKENYNYLKKLKSENNLKNNLDLKKSKLDEIKKLNYNNNISNIELENKYENIKIREKQILFYKRLFWFSFPLGLIITVIGFFKWWRNKRTDDDIRNLEKEKLKKEVERA